MSDRTKVLWGLSVVAAFFIGGMFGKEAGRSVELMDQMAKDDALQAYSDCILLRGQENCVKPMNFPQ